MKWSQKGDFQNPPPGIHPARCYMLVDLGTQPSTFQGKTSFKRKVLIGWELEDEKLDDGRPMTVYARFTQSLNANSTLRRMLKGWRGRDFTKEELQSFDSKKILGQRCQLNLVENGEYVNVDSIVPAVKPPKGAKGAKALVPEPVNEQVFFSLEPEEFDAEVLADLSDRIQEKIKASPEYAALVGQEDQAASAAVDEPEPQENPDDDSNPF